jgi:glc operon protein GlcG
MATTCAALAVVTLALTAGTRAGNALDAAAAPAPADAVTHLTNAKVQAGFEKGMPLVETDAYAVHASRRDRDGQAEVHQRDTDIFYVLEGTATLVTGGRVVNGKAARPNELRGESIAGGEVRQIGKGDVVIVPNGVPHLFKDVRQPFLYYTVKVTTPPGQQ